MISPLIYTLYSVTLTKDLKIFFDYLKQAHPARYHTLVQTCELWTYLADLDEQAWERLDAIMEQMKAAEGVTGELKTREQWIILCWQRYYVKKI